MGQHAGTPEPEEQDALCAGSAGSGESGIVRNTGSALPDESSSPAVSPVETKGYKNIVKLPDWLSARNISIKYDKPYQNGRIYHTDKWRYNNREKDLFMVLVDLMLN